MNWQMIGYLLIQKTMWFLVVVKKKIVQNYVTMSSAIMPRLIHWRVLKWSAANLSHISGLGCIESKAKIVTEISSVPQIKLDAISWWQEKYKFIHSNAKISNSELLNQKGSWEPFFLDFPHPIPWSITLEPNSIFAWMDLYFMLSCPLLWIRIRTWSYYNLNNSYGKWDRNQIRRSL